MFYPVVLRAFVVCVGAGKVGAMRVVVESLAGYVGKVAKTVPLSAALRVEEVGVIVRDILC